MIAFILALSLTADPSVSFDPQPASVRVYSYTGAYRQSPRLVGAGVCVAKRDGKMLVLTAAHCIAQTTVVQTQKELTATVLAIDREADAAALLTFDAPEVVPIALAEKSPGESEPIEWWGYAPSVFWARRGRVLRSEKHLRWLGDHGQLAIEGDSGGAIISGGKVVGLVSGYHNGEHEKYSVGPNATEIRKLLDSTTVKDWVR